MEDLFTKKELGELIKTHDSTCLSIFMPAVQAGPEVRQNPTNFAALHTVTNGGTVVPRTLVPGRALVAAIFRY